jgi:hypothetical protein
MLWVLGVPQYLLFQFMHTAGKVEIGALRDLFVYGSLNTVDFYLDAVELGLVACRHFL